MLYDHLNSLLRFWLIFPFFHPRINRTFIVTRIYLRHDISILAQYTRMIGKRKGLCKCQWQNWRQYLFDLSSDYRTFAIPHRDFTRIAHQSIPGIRLTGHPHRLFVGFTADKLYSSR